MHTSEGCQGVSSCLAPPSTREPTALHPANTSRHCCECRCAHCEVNQTGYFGQLAALAGNADAAANFSPDVVGYLRIECRRNRGDAMPAGGLIHALLHEVSGDLDAARWAVRRLTKQLGRLDRTTSAVRVLQAMVLEQPELMPPLKRRRVLRAFESLERPSLASKVEIPRSLAVNAARGSLEMVLRNLLLNAQLYAPGSMVTVTARRLVRGDSAWPSIARVALKGAAALVTVADTGSGVSAKAREHLFEATEGPKSGRIGTGLWIARTLVQAHGGDLWLIDSVHGAAFAFVWPAAIGGPDDWPAEKEEFARAVRQSREACGMTIVQLSRSTGISHDTLSKLEHGKHRANRHTRARLLKVLDLCPVIRSSKASSEGDRS